MAGERNDDTLLYIQTDLLTLTVKGSASHPSFPGTAFSEEDAVLGISCDDSFEAQFAGAYELLERMNPGRGCIEKYRLQPIFFEQQRYEIIIEPEEGHRIEFWHENYNVRKNVTPVGRKGEILSGIINFGNEIGMSDLIVRVDGKNYLKLTIEVFPSKISYKEDYKAILADVTAEVYNLVFDFLKKTYDSFDISSKQQSSPVEFFAIIRKIFREYLTAADMVIARPHHELEIEHVMLRAEKIKKADNRTLKWIEKHPDHTVRSRRGIAVDRAPAVIKHVTYNTKENRLTKYILHSTMQRLEIFKKQYLKLIRDTDLKIIDQIDDMIKSIQRRYNTGFMREVEAAPADFGMSLVFGMAPGYRDLYRCYLLLQHGLSITGNIFNVSVKDLAVLYEYWCFIKLNSLMKERYELVSQDIIKVAGNGLFVSLIKGQRSRVRYRNPENGEIITLSYNPKEISGATVPQKPDNVLSLRKKGAKINYEYVFDAKYKINPALPGSTYQAMYHTPGPQEEDINTMHRYRDAIVYKNEASPYERTMFGAYVLFPYRNQEEYRQHRFYKSIEQVNIGALPFLPSATDLVTQMLDELISDSPQSAFERATLPLGIEERLAKVDWDKRDMLLGTLRSRDQLKACLENNFYYTPAANISEEKLPIHYVALYQTARLFPEQAGIWWYAEVLRTTSQLRKNIREVKMTHNNPDERYYKFIVKKWTRREKPILPRESGFPVASTNMFLFENAEYIPELLLRSEEEYRFYSELKRKTGMILKDPASDEANQIAEEAGESPGFELGELKVLFEDDHICLYRNGRAVSQCTIQEFSQYPSATFRRLQRSIGMTGRRGLQNPGSAEQ